MTETAPFSLTRLDHLVLRTGSVDRLVRFYTELGCTVVREVARMNLVQLAAGDSMIDVIGQDGTPTDRNLDHFALRVDPFDLERILAFCRARDIEVETPEQPLLGADGYGPAVYLRDPDGNRVELKGPPERPRPDRATRT
ncbi:MAG: VOC family protein [Pseudomonadales bacterium]